MMMMLLREKVRFFFEKQMMRILFKKKITRNNFKQQMLRKCLKQQMMRKFIKDQGYIQKLGIDDDQSIKVGQAKEVAATTVNGPIRFESESVGELSSTNGIIEGRILSLKPGNGKLETVNGSVTVTISSKAALRVEAENVNGSVRSDIPGLSPEKHALAGDLNGGGSTLAIETVNGSIEVKSAG